MNEIEEKKITDEIEKKRFLDDWEDHFNHLSKWYDELADELVNPSDKNKDVNYSSMAFKIFIEYRIYLKKPFEYPNRDDVISNLYSTMITMSLSLSVRE